MKKIICLLIFLNSINFIYSQRTGISYQALILNSYAEELPGYNNPRSPLINKDICLEFGIKYTEFAPFHYEWNQYCYPPRFKYGKKYNVKHFFVQDKLIVEYVDVVIFFTDDENITKAETLKKLVEKQKKLLVFKT